MKQRQLIAGAAPTVIAALFSGYAGASGFQLLEQNGSGLSTAFAGSAAVADNASTIYFNPAGMTKLQAHEFSVGVDAVRPSFKFSNNGSTVVPGVLLTGSSGGDAGGWSAVPNGYLAWGLTKDLYLGLGVGAPFALRTEYDSDWIGRFQSIKFDIATVNINPSIAYRLSDKISLGFGVNWQRMEAEYERQAATLNALTQATRVKLDVDDEAWGWNIGALFDVSPTTRIGVSYRSTMDYTLDGTLTSTNQLVSPNVGAKADIKLPDTAIVSVTQTVNDRWQLLGDLSWTGWSRVQKVNFIRTSGAASGSTAQTLDADFRDTWRVALGGVYKFDPAWDFKFGLAYDRAPLRSDQQRLVSLPDNDRYWITGGAQWRPSKNSRLDFSAAYLFVRDTAIDNNQAVQGRGRVIGTYDSNILIFGAQYSMAF